MVIILPWPPATLSGHANGHWRSKHSLTAQWRVIGRNAAIRYAGISFEGAGDIPVHFDFTPPDRRSDRMNALTRCKAAVDGIADALGVNDRRFLPSISFNEPLKPGKVVVTIGGADGQ